MYNILKNKIYSYFYSNFVKQSYEKVSEIENEEEVYYRKNKLVVLVKNEEVGERIYEVIKTLKDRKEKIYTRNMTFEIDDFIVDKQGRVNMFCINVSTFDNEWNTLSKIEKLQELVSFVASMQNKGFYLDKSKFQKEKCNRVSNFLSFFMLDNSEVKNADGCLVEYVHYVLSNGGNLEEFYKEIIENNAICSMSDFPYTLPVIKMCYNYFVSGTVGDEIYDVLQKEKLESFFYKGFYANILKGNLTTSLLVNKEKLDSSCKQVENNDEYTIYDNNIKIYHKMSSAMEKLLENESILLANHSNKVIEQITTKIIDFNGIIIGYKFVTEEIPNARTIFDVTFKSQRELLNFVSEISDYLCGIASVYYAETKNAFDIEKSLVCIDEFSSTFKITNMKDLFDLVTTSKDCLKNQITVIFFKLYTSYLKSKYGEMDNKEQFFDKEDVRYISPILAKEFVKYALGKQVDREVATEELYTFLYDTRMSVSTGLVYDVRFEYIPIRTPFTFDYEVEKKYGIKIEKKMNQKLSDGRMLVTFKQKKKISKVKDNEDSLRAEISKKIGEVEDENVKIIDISEIVCSTEIGSDGMYKVVGYITKPIKGKRLTDEVLLSLNNKELLKVMGYLFTKFSKYYIRWNTIWMDDDFKFYINILDENCQVIEFRHSNSNETFVENTIRYLQENGYNPNAFEGVKFSRTGYSLKSYLIELADSFDSYCNEHGIYYNSSKKACPVCLKSKCYVPNNFEDHIIRIFEDSYAKHYRLNNRYNLKEYKTSCLDMDEVEANVDKIVNERLNSEQSDLGQECFIPYKKALDSNNQFIGYIYEAIQLDDAEDDINVCSDIKDSQKMKNLPRLKSLIRLILQVKEITKNDIGFIKNPFTYVFLSKGHKKQVQIANIEFLSKKGSVQDSLKWTCEYVSEILSSDSTIEVDISDCSTDLDSILEKLQSAAKDMTKYCEIHSMYYKKNYLFCPKCIDKAQMENLEFEEVERDTITEQKLDNEGGESFIYSYNANAVAKVFKEEIDYNLKSKIIVHVLGKRECLDGVNNRNLKYKYIIPRKLLVDKGTSKIFGYIMDKVRNGMPLSTLRDKAEVEKHGFTMKDVFEILITVGKGIEALHANNIYIGDLNGRNILFDSEKNVYFLDFDGMGVDNIAPKFCTEGYIDPVSDKNGNITMKDDWYSFAVQAFYYLTFTHPFNGIYSIDENGKKRKLDITEKMERRISLLGDHGMKPPTIAVPWNWMSEELRIAFLNIFEGDSRESIVPYLISQYETLYDENRPYNRSVRVNSKFVATGFNPFGRDLERMINHSVALCKKEDEYYISILVSDYEQRKLADIDFLEYAQIHNIELSEDGQIAFVVYENEVIAIDLKTSTKIYTREISDARNVVVNGNTLYFTTISEGKDIIFQTDFMSDGEVKEQKIKFLTDRQTKRLCVKFNSKFVIVKRASDMVDEIYCNSEKLCDMSYSSENSEYNIIYDDASNLWLVVNSEGNGIIIKADGRYETFNIQESISDMNIDNISFSKGLIYIPNQDCLHIINVKDQMATKKMECHEIMSPSSKLYDINTKGFSVVTDQMLYEVRKG